MGASAMKITSIKPFVEQISDDFQSTFTVIDDWTLANMMGFPNDFDQVTKIIQKYVPDAKVEFTKTNELKDAYDIYVVKVTP